MAVLAIALGQVAFLTHAVIADHGPGEVCEICVGVDRSSDAVASAQPQFDLRTSGVGVDASPQAPVASRAPDSARARAPPIL